MAAISRPAHLSPWEKAVAGAAAAVLANAIVYPLDIVKTKLQVQPKATDGTDENERYTGTLDALRKIYRKYGIRGLYTGLVGCLIGVASTNFAYFYWYGLIRGAYHKRNPRISTSMELVLGAVSGALAQLFTIPVSVVTTRQQTQDVKESANLISTAKTVVKEDGVTGLWRGLKASLVLVVNPSITYGSFERLKAIVFPGKHHLSPQQNFLLGALSKSMATVATQPLIVSKVMQQSKAAPGRRQFNSFSEALFYLARDEGLPGLFKGIGPQISKGIIVQGFLFMFKDQVELLMIILLRALKARQAVLR